MPGSLLGFHPLLAIGPCSQLNATDEAVISSDKIFILGATWCIEMGHQLLVCLLHTGMNWHARTLWVDTCAINSYKCKGGAPKYMAIG